MNNETKKFKNKFELEGNVASFSNIYTNHNGKKSLRFDLAQNSNDNTQFVPILLRGGLATTYGEQIKKGDWISVKGIIISYTKDVEKDGNTFKNKVIEILGFEITDKQNNKVYTSDGKIHERVDNKNHEQEMER